MYWITMNTCTSEAAARRRDWELLHIPKPREMMPGLGDVRQVPTRSAGIVALRSSQTNTLLHGGAKISMSVTGESSCLLIPSPSGSQV